jgi:hypothetical protein
MRIFLPEAAGSLVDYGKRVPVADFFEDLQSLDHRRSMT